MYSRTLIPVVLICGGLAVSGCAANAFLGDPLPQANISACNIVFDEETTPEKVRDLSIPVKFINSVYNNPFDANILLDCLLVDYGTWHGRKWTEKDSKLTLSSISDRKMAAQLFTRYSYFKSLDDYETLNDKQNKILGEYAQLLQYRAHIVVSLLTIYGKFNVTGKAGPIEIGVNAYGRLEQDAGTMLSRIERSEAMVREANFEAAKLADPNNDKPTDVARVANASLEKRPPEVALLDRTFMILKLAEAVERPTVGRIVEAAKDLISAIGLGGGVPLDLLGKALTALKKILIIDKYGKAWIDEARNDLAGAWKTYTDADAPKAPQEKQWARWTTYMKDSCKKIAEVANAEPHCAP